MTINSNNINKDQSDTSIPTQNRLLKLSEKKQKESSSPHLKEKWISGNNKRIAKNTLMLYTRQILILIVNLYTVRILLNVLGVDDYGIYSVVGGIVSFFSFLSGSMASATQRFFSFAIGLKDSKKLKTTFSVNLIIYISIAAIAFILLETIGAWFINHQLKVPPERFAAALWVYHFAVLTFITTIFTTPFMAIIIAHEDMQIYAYISIIEVFLKLAIVFMLLHLEGDKLKIYGTLLFGVSLVNASIYIGICIHKYKECQFRKFYCDKTLLREITGFTGWTLFGQLSTVLRGQAVTILLNQMFTPVVVAARTIATQVTNQVNFFANNFNVGLYPPIIKAYAAEDKRQMFSLVFNGAKISFFLIWIFALPLLFEMDIVLKIWLKNPPEGAVFFTRLAMVEVIINSISLPITTAARAPGKMKTYELSLGIVQIAIFVGAWIALRMGAPDYSVYFVAIVANVVMFFLRLFIVNSLTDLPISLFFKKVVIPVCLIAILSGLPVAIFHYFFSVGIVNALVNILLSTTVTILFMYYLGLDKAWRAKLIMMLLKKIKRT